MTKSATPKKGIKLSQYKHAINASYKVILCVWCFIFIILFANSSKASELGTNDSSQVTTIKQHKVIEHLRQSRPAELTNELANQKVSEVLIPLNREQHQARKQQLLSKQSKTKQKAARVSVTIQEFNIFDAYSQLFDDYDGDGYYQTFSVAFDADVYTYNGPDQALVYAEIYLSQNGGPWEYFHTTDDFMIYGESTEDEYEVVSNLTSGYYSDHYDVLIDLYEVGYAGIIATYSSDDNNSLYALPLESDEYDNDHIHHHDHGGSSGWYFSLMLMLALVVKRQLKK